MWFGHGRRRREQKFYRRNSAAMLLWCVAAGAMCIAPYTSRAEENARKLVIAADLWCPINCDPGGRELGIGVDLTKKVFEALGYRVEYKIMPWTQALEAVRAGKIDAVVGANSTDDATLIFPKTMIYDITDDFYVLHDDPWTFDSITSLKGKRIGIVADYGYNATLKQFIEKNREESSIIQEAGGNEALRQNIKKLLAGRIDIVLDSKPIIDYALRKEGLESKLRWAGSMHQGPVYIGFSPAMTQSVKRAQQFDESMKKLKERGVLEMLYSLYGMAVP